MGFTSYIFACHSFNHIMTYVGVESGGLCGDINYRPLSRLNNFMLLRTLLLNFIHHQL